MSNVRHQKDMQFDIRIKSRATNTDSGYGNPMSCKSPINLIWLFGLTIFLTGCFPTQPTYLRDSGDLSYYLNQATEIEYPDVETTRLNEVEHSQPPITVVNADFQYCGRLPTPFDVAEGDITSIGERDAIDQQGVDRALDLYLWRGVRKGFDDLVGIILNARSDDA